MDNLELEEVDSEIMEHVEIIEEIISSSEVEDDEIYIEINGMLDQIKEMLNKR